MGKNAGTQLCRGDADKKKLLLALHREEKGGEVTLTLVWMGSGSRHGGVASFKNNNNTIPSELMIYNYFTDNSNVHRTKYMADGTHPKAVLESITHISALYKSSRVRIFTAIPSKSKSSSSPEARPCATETGNHPVDGI